jgi:hypothetical protein
LSLFSCCLSSFFATLCSGLKSPEMISQHFSPVEHYQTPPPPEARITREPHMTTELFTNPLNFGYETVVACPPAHQLQPRVVTSTSCPPAPADQLEPPAYRLYFIASSPPVGQLRPTSSTRPARPKAAPAHQLLPSSPPGCAH